MCERFEAGSESDLIGVLICDDNAAIRRIITEVVVLEPGLRVVGHAADGIEVVAQARLLQPDVIILDLAMPGRTGLEALPDLALVAPHAKTIVVSSSVSPAVVAEALGRGAVTFIQKGNLMVEELVAAILAAVDTPVAGPQYQGRAG